jgi:hypothetical protein
MAVATFTNALLKIPLLMCTPWLSLQVATHRLA